MNFFGAIFAYMFKVDLSRFLKLQIEFLFIF
jgi:hypothetical protein